MKLLLVIFTMLSFNTYAEVIISPNQTIKVKADTTVTCESGNSTVRHFCKCSSSSYPKRVHLVWYKYNLETDREELIRTIESFRYSIDLNNEMREHEAMEACERQIYREVRCNL